MKVDFESFPRGIMRIMKSSYMYDTSYYYKEFKGCTHTHSNSEHYTHKHTHNHTHTHK